MRKHASSAPLRGQRKRRGRRLHEAAAGPARTRQPRHRPRLRDFKTLGAQGPWILAFGDGACAFGDGLWIWPPGVDGTGAMADTSLASRDELISCDIGRLVDRGAVLGARADGARASMGSRASAHSTNPTLALI